MKPFPAIALFVGICLLPVSVSADETARPAVPAVSDEGVKSSLTALHLNLSGSKAIPLKKAGEKALALELAVRDVASQVYRYQTYFAEAPLEMTSDETVALIAKAYQMAVVLERTAGQRPLHSHAERIRAYAGKMNVKLPVYEPDRVAVASPKSR